MTDKQALRRWIFRYEFLEHWLATKIAAEESCTYKAAVAEIQDTCEKTMKDYGFKYPLNDTDD